MIDENDVTDSLAENFFLELKLKYTTCTFLRINAAAFIPNKLISLQIFKFECVLLLKFLNIFLLSGPDFQYKVLIIHQQR